MSSHAPCPLWAADTPFPAPEALMRPAGATDAVVHRADEAYAFLHDCTVAARDGVLHVAWYNCPRAEMEEASVIRGRRSADGGRTWSAVETISEDPTGRHLHVPAVLYADGGTLYAWVLQMTAADIPAGLLLYRLGDDDAWSLLGTVADRFLPNGAPTPLPGGGWALAGRTAVAADERLLHPAVALRRESDLTGPWEVVALTPPDAPIGCPETALIADGDMLTAIVRPGAWEAGDPLRHALVSTSSDAGRTWSPLGETNLPMHPSKPFGGRLSTGQRYLAFNAPGRGGGGRELLVLAVSAPGETAFRRVWTIRDGIADDLGCGPEWSYPFAVEADGRLHVAYTSEKKHAVLTSIPLGSLAVSCGRDVHAD
ncbi:MAG: exo-alpha-sialidase, partial [Planctomycetota bacterium]